MLLFTECYWGDARSIPDDVADAVKAHLGDAGLVFLIQDAFPMQDAQAFEPVQGTTDVVGDAIFRNYVLPFEAVSFLLLAALIGAIVLARKDDST